MATKETLTAAQLEGRFKRLMNDVKGGNEDLDREHAEQLLKAWKAGRVQFS